MWKIPWFSISCLCMHLYTCRHLYGWVYLCMYVYILTYFHLSNFILIYVYLGGIFFAILWKLPSQHFYVRIYEEKSLQQALNPSLLYLLRSGHIIILEVPCTAINHRPLEIYLCLCSNKQLDFCQDMWKGLVEHLG